MSEPIVEPISAAGPWIDASEPPEDAAYLVRDEQAPDDYRVSRCRNGVWDDPLTTHFATINAPEGITP